MFFKFLIEFRLNPTLTVVCLFMCILFGCSFTYFISIISWSLKLEQLTPPCWLCLHILRLVIFCTMLVDQTICMYLKEVLYWYFYSTLRKLNFNHKRVTYTP